METEFENYSHPNGQRLSDLEHRANELERTLSDWRESLERELTEGTPAPPHTVPKNAAWVPSEQAAPRDERTEELINHGRSSARRQRMSRGKKISIAAASAGFAVLALIGALTWFRGSPSWPPSVATVQSEIAVACQNPDVAAEPGQVNFACATTTRQVLWVFALMASVDNPNFTDPKTGREGLEPITPSQGGELAWSLNLHHPYNPYNPVDSLEVAARAINNIVGGATVTSASGKTTVQPGLESSSTNCAMYTGSAAIISRQGYPSVCALPVTSTAGQGALVADIYRDWIVGTSPTTAQDAAVLFENADNPGNAQVQAILRSLTPSAP
jgi:hypothetical protein